MLRNSETSQWLRGETDPEIGDVIRGQLRIVVEDRRRERSARVGCERQQVERRRLLGVASLIRPSTEVVKQSETPARSS